MTEPDPFDYPEPADLDEPDGAAEYWRDEREAAEHRHLQHPPTAAVDELAEMRRVALTVRCRDCHRPIGQPCVRLDELGRITTEPLRKAPAHTSRQTDARKAQR